MIGRNNVVSVKRRTVIELVVQEGRGIKGDPIRNVTYFVDDDGKYLVLHDAFEEAKR